MSRPRLFEGRLVGCRLSIEDEKLFDAEKEHRKGISDSQLARELISQALRS